MVSLTHGRYEFNAAPNIPVRGCPAEGQLNCALHLFFWLIATYFGLRFLCAGFAQWTARPAGLRVWVAIFLLVMVQMTTALRPIVGTADTLVQKEKKFFVKHWLQQMKKP